MNFQEKNFWSYVKKTTGKGLSNTLYQALRLKIQVYVKFI